MNSTPPTPPLARAWTFLVERYFTVDLRTLALFRIAFGLFLFGNLYDRTQGDTGVAFFTDLGVAPVSAIIALHRAHQWSAMFAVKSVAELHVALVAIVLVYAAYTVGWRTRWMQVLVLGILVSLDQRNLMLENGGGVVANIAAVLTAFLPLGERFSVDALVRPRPARATVARLAYGILVLDLAVIYFFNFVNKSGPTWQDGTALHLALWYPRTANSVSFWLRNHEPFWFSPAMSRATVCTELTLATLIVTPVFQRQARWTAILLIVGLHGGIAVMMRLGPFSYVMMCMSILLLGSQDWDDVERFARRHFAGLVARTKAQLDARFPPTTALPEPRSHAPTTAPERFVLVFRDGAVLVIAAASVCSVLFENTVPARIHLAKSPDWAAAVIDSLRIAQRWSMFAPDPARNNAMLVIDGELENHEHVDPLTGEPPDFECMFHPPPDDREPWRNYLFRINTDRYAKLRPYLGDYLLRVHALPYAKIREPLARLDAYWVSWTSPLRAGEPVTNIKKKLLFSRARSTGNAAPEPAPPASAPAPEGVSTSG